MHAFVWKKAVSIFSQMEKCNFSISNMEQLSVPFENFPVERTVISKRNNQFLHTMVALRNMAKFD